jgi:hypothetical protein
MIFFNFGFDTTLHHLGVGWFHNSKLLKDHGYQVASRDARSIDSEGPDRTCGGLEHRQYRCAFHRVWRRFMRDNFFIDT